MITRETLSDFILDLYKGVDFYEATKFKSWALERLGDLIQFDSGIWVQGVVIDGLPIVNNVYLHNQPESLLVEYAKWSEDDLVLDAVLRNPGRCILWREAEDPDEMRQTGIYKEYLSKYGIEDALSILVRYKESGIGTHISTYRSEIDQPFTVADRDCLQLVASHLIQAEKLIALKEARRFYQVDEPEETVGVITPGGHLKLADSIFLSYLKVGWPDWEPPQVPECIRNALPMLQRKGGVMNGFHIRVMYVEQDVLIVVRPAKVVDVLSKRERQIARMFAEGLTYNDVSNKLKISPSTVTNHANSIYRKVGVSRKADLFRALQL